MKKRSRPASKKSAKGKKKPIMRHSREGVKSRTKRSTRPKRAASSRSGARKVAASKAKRAVPKKRTAAKELLPKLARRRRGDVDLDLMSLAGARGMESLSGIQSGDLEGLSRVEDADSESVEELLEEGQAFEAGVISGVEEADARPGEVRTREVSMDDVPQEYLDED